MYRASAYFLIRSKFHNKNRSDLPNLYEYFGPNKWITGHVANQKTLLLVCTTYYVVSRYMQIATISEYFMVQTANSDHKNPWLEIKTGFEVGSTCISFVLV